MEMTGIVEFFKYRKNIVKETISFIKYVMNYFFNGANVFYDFCNIGAKQTTVVLHGWGRTSRDFSFVKESVKHNLLFVDFPPFGNSRNEPQGWTIFTYASMLISLCEHLKIEKFNLLGHSFGGRVAIIVGALCKDKVEKIMLVSSAGVRPKRRLKYYWKVWWYKFKKKLGVEQKNVGSEDYRNLSDNMKKVFCNIVNTHLEDFLPQICARVLIVFGKNDETTPLYMAKILHEKIVDSQLEILEGAGHFCFYDRRTKFVSLMKNFLS